MLKDCEIYIRELERLIDPQVLLQLQHNLNNPQYRDQVEFNSAIPLTVKCEPGGTSDKSPRALLTDHKSDRKRRRVEPPVDQAHTLNGMMGDPDQFHSCKRMFTQTTTYHEYEWAEARPSRDHWGPSKRATGSHYIGPGHYIPFDHLGGTTSEVSHCERLEGCQ